MSSNTQANKNIFMVSSNSKSLGKQSLPLRGNLAKENIQSPTAQWHLKQTPMLPINSNAKAKIPSIGVSLQKEIY